MERFASAQKANISGVYGDETFVQPHVSTGKMLHREHRKGTRWCISACAFPRITLLE